MLLFLGAGATGSDDDLSSLTVDDVEGQMAKFVAKTLRVCSRFVVLTYSVVDLEI